MIMKINSKTNLLKTRLISILLEYFIKLTQFSNLISNRFFNFIGPTIMARVFNKIWTTRIHCDLELIEFLDLIIFVMTCDDFLNKTYNVTLNVKTRLEMSLWQCLWCGVVCFVSDEPPDLGDWEDCSGSLKLSIHQSQSRILPHVFWIESHVILVKIFSTLQSAVELKVNIFYFFQ